MKTVGRVFYVGEELTLAVTNCFLESDSLVFRKFINLIPFHVFLTLLMLDLE